MNDDLRHIHQGTTKLKGPARRLTAFLEERRVIMPEDQVISRGSGKKTVKKAPLNLAEWRLEALRTAREKEGQELKESKKGKRGSRAPIVAPPANNWIPIGPSISLQGQAPTRPSTAGRTPGIAVAPGGARIYAATANGGVWRSDNAGNGWITLMDPSFDFDPIDTAAPRRQVDSLACGAIALAAGDTAAQDTVFVGTGEAHTGTGSMFGIGPLVSKNGGATWAQEPVAGGVTLLGEGFFALALDPGDPDRVVAATSLGVFSREPLGGGAFNWVQRNLDATITNSPNIAVSSVVVARTGGSTSFFAVPHGGRRVYFSTDGGQNWNQLGNQLPNNLNRMTLAVRCTDPTVVYLFASTGRIFRFEQADGRWRSVNGLPPASQTVGTQGWYDLAIAVAPDNPNRIYIGGSTVASNLAGNVLATAPTADLWAGAVWRFDINVTRSGTTVTGLNVPAAQRTFLGASIHADIHTIVFSKNQDGDDDPNQMWVGCDGGVYYTNTPTGNGRIFVSKNNGMQTLMMHHLALHPTEDSVIFCGTQDNGGLLFTGEESWLHSTPGDCGYAVIDWNNPSRIISTRFNNGINVSTNGGATYNNPNLTLSGVPILVGENILFYSPLAGTPNSGVAADASIVAFGSERPWISPDFGTTWRSIPNNTLAGDRLDGTIRALEFANANRLFAGTTNGSVYRFDRNVGTGAWTRTQIYDNNTDTPNAWFNNSAVTDIAVDPANQNIIFITLSRTGAFDHVWRYDGAAWATASGTGAPLPPVHHSAIVIDPQNNNNLFVGTDIGTWRSPDGGTTWQTFSQGLPDVAVLDLKILPRRQDPNDATTTIRPAILRASTHGRGVWERRIDTEIGFAPVELFIRRTELDLGRHRVIEGLNTIGGTAINVEKSPGIKLDIPSSAGSYQLAQTPGEEIDFVQFTTQLTDSGQAVTHDTEVRTRVYVQVHNRGVMPANDVRVTLLYASQVATLPALPSGYEENIRNGVSINTADWKTVGSVILHNVRVGFPKIATFDLSSTMLPAPAELPPLPTDDFVLLALVHHADDTYSATETDARVNVLAERKAAIKSFPINAFVGTPPALASARPPLNGFIALQTAATAALQPFDTMLADALRLNDVFLKNKMESSLATPMAGRVHDTNVLTNPSVREIVMAEEINLTSAVALDPKVPLVWFARTKITLRNTINAAGKGSPQSEAGDFGGSGGGGSTNGGQCTMPMTGITLLTGGATGTGAGNSLDPDWATRALLHPAVCKGGAGGGGANGGVGGGVVILCAPVIEFAAGGQINAGGQDATGVTSGGGGGGLIALIAREIIGLKEAPDAAANAIVAGGNGNGGGRGGDGLVLKKIFN